MDSPDHLKIWIKKGMDNWKGKKNALDPKFSLIMHRKKRGKNPHMKTPTNENKKHNILHVYGLYYLVPFGINLLWVDGSIGVGAGNIHVIGLHNFGNLIVNSQDGQALFVSLW